MKRAYVRPTAICEEFAANEYVATCGKHDGKYIFTCDAPAGPIYYYNGQTATKIGDYHDCGKKHITDGPDNYYDGFVDYNGNETEDRGEHCLVWIEWDSFMGWRYISNAHGSASLTREQIETERS